MPEWMREHRVEAWARVLVFDGLVVFGSFLARHRGINNWLIDGICFVLIWFVTGKIMRTAYSADKNL